LNLTYQLALFASFNETNAIFLLLGLYVNRNQWRFTLRN